MLGGMDVSSSTVDHGDGTVDVLWNARLSTMGEAQRRRGIARAALAKKADSVRAMLSISPVVANKMMALADGTRMQGYVNAEYDPVWTSPGIGGPIDGSVIFT